MSTGHASIQLTHPRLADNGEICCSHSPVMCASCLQHHNRNGTLPAAHRTLAAHYANLPVLRAAGTASFAPPDAYAAALQRLRENT